MSQSFSSPKGPGETVVLTFDFTPELGAEPIIGLPTVSVSLTDVAPPNADSAPAAILNGAAQVSSGMVLQSVKSGISGMWYRIEVGVATATRFLVLVGILGVADS